MARTTPQDVDTSLPTGGLWGRQQMYGGLRLDQEFEQKQEFILWGLSSPGEVELEDDQKADKTILQVSRISEPDEKFEVGTLSKAINEMVDHVSDGDLPAVVYWEEVETKRKMQPAKVLTAVRLYRA